MRKSACIPGGMRKDREMKTGLVLEGGAMRGMYTAGILDVFLDKGIPVDGIVGVSAGALFGVNYLSGQRGRVIRYNKRFNGDPDYMGLRPLLREGNIVSTSYAYSDVPRRLDPFDDEAFRRSAVPFYAVLTDIRTGQPAYIRISSVFEQMDLLRASGSMPFVSKPVSYEGNLYLDGGISDSIPYRWMADQGYDRLIVVLTRDLSYQKKPMPRLPVNLYYRRYPALRQRLLTRHLLYRQQTETLKEWEASGRAFVIRPSSPIGIRRIEKDPDKLQQVYELGLCDAEACMPALQAYLAGQGSTAQPLSSDGDTERQNHGISS